MNSFDVFHVCFQILTYVKKDHRTEVEVAIRTSLKAYEDEGSQQELDFESLSETELITKARIG